MGSTKGYLHANRLKTLVKGCSSLHPNLIKIWWNLEKPFKTNSRQVCLEVKKNQMNGRNKATALTSVLLLILSFVAGGLYLVAANSDQDDVTTSNPPSYMGGWSVRGPFFGCLDEAQRQELKEAIDAMMDEGATPEEIRAHVQGYLDQLGIECQKPTIRTTPRISGQKYDDKIGFERRMPQLSVEQLEGLEQLRAEIQELVKQRLEELDINMPFMSRGLSFGHRDVRFANKQGS